MAGTTIVVLEGDETGQELLEEALRVLAPEVTGIEVELLATTSRSRRDEPPRTVSCTRPRPPFGRPASA
jgi:hypothetical protein